MRLALIPVVVASCAVAVSCRSTVPFSESARARVRTVSTEVAITQPPLLDYYGPAMEGFEPFPTTMYSFPVVRELVMAYSITPFGLWTIKKSFARMEEALTARMSDEGIDAGKIVERAFFRQLATAEGLLEPVEGEADALLTLDVECGLANAKFGLEYGVRPWLEVEGRLTDRDGTLVWRRRAEVTTSNERIPAYDADKLYREPELFRHGVERAAAIVARELVDHLEHAR